MAGTDCTDWHPGHRHPLPPPESGAGASAEVGERAHFRMQWRWKMEKQLPQDQIGAERRTMS